MVRNHYTSARFSELSAKVTILKDMLLFRENPSLCIGLFDTDEIATAIKCICTNYVFSPSYSLSVYCIYPSLSSLVAR